MAILPITSCDGKRTTITYFITPPYPVRRKKETPAQHPNNNCSGTASDDYNNITNSILNSSHKLLWTLKPNAQENKIGPAAWWRVLVLLWSLCLGGVAIFLHLPRPGFRSSRPVPDFIFRKVAIGFLLLRAESPRLHHSSVIEPAHDTTRNFFVFKMH